MAEKTKYLDYDGLAHVIRQLYARGFNGMGLSHEDFTAELAGQLSALHERLKDFDPSQVAADSTIAALAAKVEGLAAVINSEETPDGNTVIDKLNEVFAFLSELDSDAKLKGILDGKADMSLVVKLHASITASCNPSAIYKGETSAVRVGHSASFDGKALAYTPKVGGEALAASYDCSDSRTFDVVFEIDNPDPAIRTTVTRQARVTAYYPRYYGRSSAEELTAADVTALEKQPVSGSAAMSGKTISSAEADYLWLCVPAGMTVSEVTSGGFAVPMEAPQTVAVPGKGSYSCYRSTNKANAGSVTYNIK